MSMCFLAGQHDAPEAIRERLCTELERLVQLHGVTEMIVGHRGNFDRMATAAVQAVLRKRPELYGRALVAYRDSPDNVPLRCAIVRANQIALVQCDFFLTYCNREGGNAGKLLQQAKRMAQKGDIQVINLAQDDQ